MKCDRCQNQAAYSRRYSGENLCGGCFSDSIQRKTARTISKYNMIRSGQLVCVGVSGGKDSLALLYVLSRMAETHNFRIMAVTIDEGIPGYRDEALGIVERYCAELGVQYRVYSYGDLFGMTLDEALTLRDTKTTSCSICGTLRRRALDRAAEELGADVIATAHNKDDSLQTFLINMISGDVTRIGWMDPDATPDGIRRIKPFDELHEAEIAFFAFTNGIPFQTEPCPHMNEGIRTEIRRFLNALEDGHAGAKNNMYRSTQKVAQAVRGTGSKVQVTCPGCGSRCTGDTCSVCSMVLRLKGRRG
jgi:uncharacterized protein (TIGR00269 family)